MDYSDLDHDVLIIMAIEFVGRDTPIPEQIRQILGPDLIREIENPE